MNGVKYDIYINDKKGKYKASGKLLSDNNFKIFKGSTINQEYSKGGNYKLKVTGKRNNLLDIKVKVIDGNLTFVKDVTFTSPSLATAIITGRSSNGWHD